MIIHIQVGKNIYKSNIHPYASLHRAIIQVKPDYHRDSYIIYKKDKVCCERDSIQTLIDQTFVDPSDRRAPLFEIVPKMKGGVELSKSYLFYFILFLITLSPIYFMYVGIVPLKAFLSRRILTKALEPLGKYLVCVLGKKTLYSRILLGTSILKYFIFIFAVFVTFTLPLIVLCILMGVLMKHNTLTDSPAKLEGPVKAGYTTGIIFTLIHMVTYFGYRWFDYFADFFIQIFNQSYYTRMVLVPPLESMKRTFDNFKGIGVITATMGYASDVKGLIAGLGGAIQSLQGVMKKMLEQGCETVGVDEIEESFKKGLKELKSSELEKFEIKGRDRKKFCFDFNEYLDANEFEKTICSRAGNEECCTPSVFYKIASGMYQVLTASSTVAELVKKGLAMFGITGHVITANIAFFEEAMESGDPSGIITDGIYLTKSQLMIKDHRDPLKDKRGSTPFIYEEQLEEKISEYTNQGLKVQALYDEKYRNYKENIVGVLNLKEKITFNEMRNKINELKRMLNDYNASYNDDDVIVKYVFKPYFVSNICEVLNGVRATRDFSEDIGGLDNAVDILRSGMFTGRWMILLYLITYLILVILGFLKVYLK